MSNRFLNMTEEDLLKNHEFFKKMALDCGGRLTASESEYCDYAWDSLEEIELVLKERNLL